MDESAVDEPDAGESAADEPDAGESVADEPELDLDETGGPLAIGIVAVLAGLFVAILGAPLLGLSWTQALVVGLAGGLVAAVAAAVGSRHATPE